MKTEAAAAGVRAGGGGGDCVTRCDAFMFAAGGRARLLSMFATLCSTCTRNLL
jgi:hypothetical protein